MKKNSSVVPQKHKKFSDDELFKDVAELLEKTENSSSGPDKLRRIKKYIASCRARFKSIHGSLDSDAAHGDSIYPVIRILLPTEDRGRTAYNIHAIKLGRILSSILALGKDDTLKLTKFKNPGKSGSAAGDFGSIVFSVIQSRFSNYNPALESITITKLNSILDELAATSQNQDDQKKILREIFIKCNITPVESKWLCRILLKQLFTGVNKTLIFSVIHPKAKDKFELIGNLEKVCQQLNDPDVVLLDDAGIQLFYYCRPMLCTRMVDVNDGFQVNSSQELPSAEEKKSSRKKTVTLPTPPYYVETKWDGERFQIHFDGSIFKYFSRRGHDFSKSFDQTLTPKLRLQIKPGVKSFILDGEMMAWHKKFKYFTQKGEQIDVKKMNTENQNHCPVFVAFDILYLNEQVLIDKPLDERIKRLHNTLEAKEGVLVLSEQKILENSEQVVQALNEAIDNLEEGLIVKNMKSIYEPGKRLLTWLKIKPEFLDGNTVDDLDLLIVGAYFGDSVRSGGTISHFLVAVIKQCGSREEFYPVAQVGSGRLRNPEMKALVEDLRPNLVKSEFKNVIYKGKKRPDLFIDPKKSIVVQIKASEINTSDNFVINYTLRFPRITTVRRDKPYNEVMSLDEFHRLRESSGGKLVKRTDRKGFSFFRKRDKNVQSDNENTDEDEEADPNSKRQELINNLEDEETDEPMPSTSRVTRSSALISLPSPVKQNATGSNVLPSRSNIFNSKVFCVYGQAAWKSKMESDIKAHGGQIVQNPVFKEKFWIVGEKPSNIKVAKAISSSCYDVFKSSWIEQCIEKNAEVEFKPDDFYTYTEETFELFKDKYDKFGDSYTKSISLDETKTLISKIMKMDEEAEEESDDEVDDYSEEFEGFLNQYKINPSNFLKHVKVAFRDTMEPVLAAKVEFYGGKVEEDEQNATHIIVKDKNPPSPSKRLKPSILTVTKNWLEACFEKQALVDAIIYQT